jgi:hypothetical protein
MALSPNGALMAVPRAQGRSYEDRVGVVSVIDVPGRGELRGRNSR